LPGYGIQLHLRFRVRDNSSAQVGKPRTVWEIVGGQIVSKTMYAYTTDYDAYVQVASQSSDGWDAAGNEKSYSGLDSQNRPTQVDSADGTYTTYLLRRCVRRLTTTKTYDAGSTEFRRVEEQVNTLGRMVSRKTSDIGSSTILIRPAALLRF